MTDSKLGPAEVWTSRQALQDLYQKMLVTDLEYALDKKVEQDLWNHAFKNQITTLQGQAKNRANPNRSEVQANLSLFLEAASGFYTQVSSASYTVFPGISGILLFVHIFSLHKYFLQPVPETSRGLSPIISNEYKCPKLVTVRPSQKIKRLYS
uniref:Protein SMG7-like n=2 Tax=Castor canadensis TaxID=51338 RepID=A0A8B7V2R6_CASCN|nr:protein SMG7-like [Castor canadensis]